MTSEQFANLYLQHQTDILKVLNSKRIFDADLLHDTYIALHDHAQQATIDDFVSTFVAFYRARYKRRSVHESHYMVCDNATLTEHYDRAEEESDIDHREQVGQRIDRLLRYFASHPQPGERNHKRTCKILRLYCQGLNESEISNKLKISQQAVSQTLARSVKRLKLVAKRL
ncbi:MAG: sigma-70 family RNA polymerase sigma factor [Paludibacteraceae bacterium]|nr:sigma-70 family RNA polymerase sigma factor [Paludibacteraceae bacterium]